MAPPRGTFSGSKWTLPEAHRGSACSASAAPCRTPGSRGAGSFPSARLRAFRPLTLLLLLTASAPTGGLHARQPAAPPIPGLPGSWRILPEFSDEFDSPSLNRAKWQPSNPEWGGHPPALYQESNVSLRNGRLLLRMKAGSVPDMPEGYHDFTCAIIRSRQRVRYGYFEIRAQAGRSAATSAFWFYHNGPDIWTEIDVDRLREIMASRSARALILGSPPESVPASGSAFETGQNRYRLRIPRFSSLPPCSFSVAPSSLPQFYSWGCSPP